MHVNGPLSIRYILSTVLALAVLASCTTMTDDEQLAIAKGNLSNPAKRLTITVTSEPSGASVFGVNPGIAFLLQDAQPSEYLGKTPLTLTYTRVGSAIFGSLPDKTLVIKESDASPMGPAQASLEFQCMVIMDGYKRYTISEVIEDRTIENDPLGRGRVQSFDTGVSKTYNAKLVPGEVEHAVLKTPTTTKGNDDGKPALVSVTSIPDGAEISVDGAFMGNAPCELPLAAGDHTVEAKLPGYKPYKRTIKVLSGATLTLKATLEKE